MRTELPKSCKKYVVSKALLLFGHMGLDSRGVPRLAICSRETGSLPKIGSGPKSCSITPFIVIVSHHSLLLCYIIVLSLSEKFEIFESKKN